MKKLFLVCLILVSWLGLAFADSITLTSPEDLQEPQATKIKLRKVEINMEPRYMVVHYSWATATSDLRLSQRLVQTWICQDREDDPGTPEDETSTCFTDVFKFSIRTQDVGTMVGIALRDLVWFYMKQDILSGGNDGSFD